jgi:Flp pilus assembly protein TadG
MYRARRPSWRGNAFVEFSFVLLPLMALFFGAFDFCYAIFVKATLHHAVREGVRFAITGRLLDGQTYHDESIRQVVKRNALGLVSSEENYNRIKIDYFLADGLGSTPNNAAGNIVVVSVANYPVLPVASLFRTPGPFTLTVGATDKMEPFPGAPPPRSATP